MNAIDHPALYPMDATTVEPELDAYMALKPAQKAFVDAYISTLGQSARAAGKAISDVLRNSPIDPGERGKWMMRDAMVKRAIAQRARELSQKFEVDANSLLKEIANIAFANMGNYVHIDEDGLPYFDFSSVTHAQMGVIKSLTVEELPEDMTERAERLARPGGFDMKPKLRKKVKLELHDKNNAHEKLMRFMQLYAPERLDIHHTVEVKEAVASMTNEQLAEMYAASLKVIDNG